MVPRGFPGSAMAMLKPVFVPSVPVGSSWSDSKRFSEPGVAHLIFHKLWSRVFGSRKEADDTELWRTWPGVCSDRNPAEIEYLIRRVRSCFSIPVLLDNSSNEAVPPIGICSRTWSLISVEIVPNSKHYHGLVRAAQSQD